VVAEAAEVVEAVHTSVVVEVEVEEPAKPM
jgi:hypothetical protein